MSRMTAKELKDVKKLVRILIDDYKEIHDIKDATLRLIKEVRERRAKEKKDKAARLVGMKRSSKMKALRKRQATIDEKAVRRMVKNNHNISTIALALDCTPEGVRKLRKRLGF